MKTVLSRGGSMSTDCIKNTLSTQTKAPGLVPLGKHINTVDSSTVKEADSGAEMVGRSEVGWRSRSSWKAESSFLSATPVDVSNCTALLNQPSRTQNRTLETLDDVAWGPPVDLPTQGSSCKDFYRVGKPSNWDQVCKRSITIEAKINRWHRWRKGGTRNTTLLIKKRRTKRQREEVALWNSVAKTLASSGWTPWEMCTTLETGQTMTASINTIRAPDFKLGGPINKHAELIVGFRLHHL